MSEIDAYSAPPLPVAVQPKGWPYLFGTWSGRLFLVNAAVFAFVCIKTGSLFLPDTSTLLAVGAKDPVGLARGEAWRLFTPMFIHIGILHFAVNSYMLYAIGYQLEKILGGWWFLLTYLIAGVAGNTASAVFSVNLSAGASSSLFGLLGAGFYLERSTSRRIQALTGRRPRNRAYAMTVAINLAFGFIVPFIDNSAHLGGLAAGTMLAFVMVNLRPNNLQAPRRFVGIAAATLLLLVVAIGAYFGTSPSYILERLEKAGDMAEDPEERIYHYSQAVKVRPDDSSVRIKRARELFLIDEATFAFQDVRAVLGTGEHGAELRILANELEAKGRAVEAWQVRRMAGRDGS